MNLIGVSEKIWHENKENISGFIALLDTLGASLLWNMLGKENIQLGERDIR